MTKKDYQLIAGVLKDTNATAKTCQAMADELHRASGYTPNGNKSFNDYKFLTACGVREDIK